MHVTPTSSQLMITCLADTGKDRCATTDVLQLLALCQAFGKIDPGIYLAYCIVCNGIHYVLLQQLALVYHASKPVGIDLLYRCALKYDVAVCAV
jgi:hypothetical protein